MRPPARIATRSVAGGLVFFKFDLKLLPSLVSSIHLFLCLFNHQYYACFDAKIQQYFNLFFAKILDM